MVLLTPGRELKVVMAMRDMTARKVAQRVGVSEWAVSRILNDQRQTDDPELIARIREAIFEGGER